MPPPVDPTVLRRKIAAHARPGPAGTDPAPVALRGFGRALRHAAAPFEGLGLVLGEVTQAGGQTLGAALDALPGEGLVAVLEAGEEGARGLIALSPGLIDALIEVQTTGRVEATGLPPRPVTRIDEALVRDFIDLALAAFTREAGAAAGRDWPMRMVYGSRVRDRAQITLLLPEARYRVLCAELGFDGVSRRAQATLVLPFEASTDRGDSADAAVRAPPDAAWCAARDAMLAALRLPAEAVLMRMTRPLGEVQRLEVGALLPFGPGDLQEVALESPSGAVLAQGRLGQIGGRRALRLPGAASVASVAAPATPAPSAALPDAADAAPGQAADIPPAGGDAPGGEAVATAPTRVAG